MNLGDYNPNSLGDFEILLHKYVAHQKRIKPSDKKYNKEDHFKEILLEVFSMGLKCGKLAVNKPIDLKAMCK